MVMGEGCEGCEGWVERGDNWGGGVSGVVSISGGGRSGGLYGGCVGGGSGSRDVVTGFIGRGFCL